MQHEILNTAPQNNVVDKPTNHVLTTDMSLLSIQEWDFTTIVVDMLKNFASEVNTVKLCYYDVHLV